MTKADVDDYMIKTNPVDILQDDTKYLYIQGSLLDDNYVITMIKKGMNVFYHTNDSRRGHAGLVPDNVLEAYALSNRGAIIFGMEKEPHRDYIANVEQAHEATKVIIDCPVVIPDVSPNGVLMSLAPLSTNVDEVQVDMMPLHSEELRDFEKPYYYFSIVSNLYEVYPKSMFDYFKQLKSPLSGWGMIINLLVNDTNSIATINDLVKQDKWPKDYVIRHGLYIT